MNLGLGVLLGEIYSNKQYGVQKSNAQFDDDMIIVEKDQLPSEINKQPKIEESLDMMPQMDMTAYQFSPYYRSYAAPSPFSNYHSPLYMPSYFDINPEDIRFLHYMRARQLSFNRYLAFI